MGYRLILKENGTQSLGSVEKYEKGGYMAKGGNIEGEWAVLIGKRKKRILKKGMTKEEAKNYILNSIFQTNIVCSSYLIFIID